LRNSAHAICEKPLVLNPWNLDALAQIEAETGKRVYSVMQLRLHPAIVDLRRRIAAAPPDKVFDVDLTYLTSRGRWYYISWKGDEKKSGGIASNIGIHFFDILGWIFGARRASRVHIRRDDAAAGFLEFARARVRWFLSTNPAFLPQATKDAGKRTFRSITVDGVELKFSDGFTDLHTAAYADILAAGGFGIEDARGAIETAHEIRNGVPLGFCGEYHPLATLANG
jgi:UDP-N-acetyl-2-amino-2-deoxyglucuronate dehydrogenase